MHLTRGVGVHKNNQPRLLGGIAHPGRVIKWRSPTGPSDTTQRTGSPAEDEPRASQQADPSQQDPSQQDPSQQPTPEIPQGQSAGQLDLLVGPGWTTLPWSAPKFVIAITQAGPQDPLYVHA